LLRFLLKLCRLLSRSSRFVDQAVVAGLFEVGVRRLLLRRFLRGYDFLCGGRRAGFCVRARPALLELIDRDRQLLECGGEPATPAADQDRQPRLAVRILQFVQ
jgi:hypothetical protein